MQLSNGHIFRIEHHHYGIRCEGSALQKLVRNFLEDSKAAGKKKARQLSSMTPTTLKPEEEPVPPNPLHMDWECVRPKWKETLGFPTESSDSSLAGTGKASPTCNKGWGVVCRSRISCPRYGISCYYPHCLDSQGNCGVMCHH